MKKRGYFFVLTALTFIVLSVGSAEASVTDYSKYFRTDSAVIFSWNETSADWDPTAIVFYTYDNDLVLQSLTVSYSSRAEMAKTVNEYNEDNKLTYQTNYSFIAGTWVMLTRNVYSYNSSGLISEIYIQKWVNSEWQTDRIQYDYVYNTDDKTVEFKLIYWRNNAWTAPKVDYSYYDDEGKLVKREAIYDTGATDYVILYSYDDFDLLAEAYSQYPSGTGWANWWLVNYFYNKCGMKVSQIQYAGSGTEWVPATKTVSYSYFNPGLYPFRKVPVCLKDRTIYVPTYKAEYYLAHGACIGECINSCPPQETVGPGKPKIPFKIFPNPADDHITVTKNSTDVNISSVQLFDINGKLLLEQTVDSDNEITVYRNGYKSGTYFLKINGDETYSFAVVFN